MVEFTGKVSDFLKIGAKAAARGHVKLVREILKAKPRWIHRVGSHGRTLLWEAAHKGKLEMVKYLVRRKSDINACGGHYTPYFVEISCYCIAKHKKHLDVAEFLLSKGAVLDIHTAAFLGDLDAVKRFVKKKKTLVNAGHPQHVMGKKRDDGLDVYPEPAKWATPLCYALRGGDVETVEFLIKKGARVQGIEKNLFISADNNYDMIRLLLENGADSQLAPEVLPDEGKLYKLVKSYGGKGPSIKTLGEELIYLCRGDRGGNPKEVKRLLDLGADVDFQDHKGKTALHRASKAGFIAAMQVLLKHGANANVEDLKGETALFETARSTIKDSASLKKAIKLLLKSGADAGHGNRRSLTPFEIAKGSKRVDAKSIARLLKK